MARQPSDRHHRLILLSLFGSLLLLSLFLPAAGKGGDIGPGEDFDDYSDEYGADEEDDGEGEGEGEREDEGEGEGGPGSHIRGVLELDDVTFDQIVDGSRHVFVEFYAPWCSHCKALVGELKLVAESLEPNSDILIAKVNAEKYTKIAQRFGVKGYPSLKRFPIGSKTPEDYDGERTAKNIVEFLKGGGGKRGTVEKLEGLVKTFVLQKSERERVREMVEEAVRDFKGEEAKSGEYYIKVMSNVFKNGDNYITKEISRLERVLKAGGLKSEKISEFKNRVNILKVFVVTEDDM